MVAVAVGAAVVVGVGVVVVVGVAVVVAVAVGAGVVVGVGVAVVVAVAVVVGVAVGVAMTQAAILVGGRGTRLGALTDETPKPLLDVAGVPFLDHVIRHLRDRGAARFLLLAGFAAMRVVEYAREADRRLEVPIYVSIEPGTAGTGGALHHARPRLEETFLLANGDTYFDVDPRVLVEKLRVTPSALGVLAQRPSGLSGGLYAVRREFVDEHLRPVSRFATIDLDERIVAFGRFVGVVHDGYFVDIGTPAELERARRDLSKG